MYIESDNLHATGWFYEKHVENHLQRVYPTAKLTAWMEEAGIGFLDNFTT